MKLPRFILCALVMFLAQTAFTQTDSTQIDTDSLNNDSLNAALLEEFNDKLAQIEQQRRQDSLERVELEAQLNALKTTDNLKKEELEQKLRDLEQKETQRLAEKKAQIDSLKQSVFGFPVLGFFHDTLFVIYNRLGSFSAKERAAAISNRIEYLGNVIRFHTDSLQIVEEENSYNINFHNDVIVSISENDALWNNATISELANDYKQIIGNEVMRYQSETSISKLAKKIALAILVILFTWVLIRYTNKLFNLMDLKIREQENLLLKGFKIKTYTLLDAKRQVNALSSINNTIKWFAIILIIYIALSTLFGIFPQTENLADTLFGYVLNPLKKILHAFWNYLPNLITIVVIMVVFRYVLKGFRFLKIEIEREKLNIPGFYPDWANPTYQIIRVLSLAFLIVVIFPYLPGHDSPVFQGVSVFLGFLLTFGSASSLSNIVSGLVLTYMRIFKIGDRVKIGEVMGDVVEKSLLVTRIRTIKNEIISIPNSTVMNSHSINYSSDAPEKGLIIHTTVTIGYDVPWKSMQEALIEAAARTEFILKDPKPFVLQTSLEDFYVAYQINAYTREANRQATIYSELHRHILDVCNEKGIEILSPHYRATRDGNMTTIPADYLPKDYKMPGFNVFVKKDSENDQSP